MKTLENKYEVNHFDTVGVVGSTPIAPTNKAHPERLSRGGPILFKPSKTPFNPPESQKRCDKGVTSHCGETLVPLSRGKKTRVDEIDFDAVMKHRWYAHHTGKRFYATRSTISDDGTRKLLKLHSFLMQPPVGKIVDHINGDTLDNRRSNLRICTQQQNTFNSSSRGRSKYRGIYWQKCKQKWRAQISKDGKSRSLGLFRVEEDAARAYDVAAKKLHKSFARLNFPSHAK